MFSFHFGIIIFVFYSEAVVRRCSLKRCSKRFRKIHKKTPVPVPFFLWRDAAHCFPKSLTIFTKSSAVDVRLGHNYISLLTPDLKPIYKDFLLRKLLIKNATALYYHHRFIIQRGKIE